MLKAKCVVQSFMLMSLWPLIKSKRWQTYGEWSLDIGLRNCIFTHHMDPICVSIQWAQIRKKSSILWYCSVCLIKVFWNFSKCRVKIFFNVDFNLWGSNHSTITYCTNFQILIHCASSTSIYLNHIIILRSFMTPSLLHMYFLKWVPIFKMMYYSTQMNIFSI